MSLLSTDMADPNFIIWEASSNLILETILRNLFRWAVLQRAASTRSCRRTVTLHILTGCKLAFKSAIYIIALNYGEGIADVCSTVIEHELQYVLLDRQWKRNQYIKYALCSSHMAQENRYNRKSLTTYNMCALRHASCCFYKTTQRWQVAMHNCAHTYILYD